MTRKSKAKGHTAVHLSAHRGQSFNLSTSIKRLVTNGSSQKPCQAWQRAQDKLDSPCPVAPQSVQVGRGEGGLYHHHLQGRHRLSSLHIPPGSVPLPPLWTNSQAEMRFCPSQDHPRAWVHSPLPRAGLAKPLAWILIFLKINVNYYKNSSCLLQKTM